MTNTKVNYEGTSYTLIEDAYLTNYKGRAVYEAEAIKTDSKENELGLNEIFTIRWRILTGGNLNEYFEEDLCEWQTPEQVVLLGYKDIS